mmetsp:Transcript_17685/g.26497  ORF Transcript_17685/g.26497 Transcript_17685/m.26497 type:complete len:397 (+) Transcript_17685:56-1246(+)
MAAVYGSMDIKIKKSPRRRRSSVRKIVSVEHFLKEVQLEEFFDAFKKNGITDLDHLISHNNWRVFESIGNATGMNLGQVMRLYVAVREQHRIAEDLFLNVGDDINLGDLVSPSARMNEEREKRYFAKDLPERPNSRKIPRCCRICRMLVQMGSFIDFFIPIDHQPIFRRKMIHSLSGAQLKDQVLRSCESWILVYALIFNSVISLWGLLPSSATHLEAMVWEWALIMICALSLGSCIIYSVIDLNVSAVHPSNMKAHTLAITDAYNVAEAVSMLTANGLMALTFFMGYLRIRHAAGNFDSDWGVVYGLSGYFLSILVLSVTMRSSINFITYVTIRSGVMDNAHVALFHVHEATGDQLKKEEEETMNKVLSRALDPESGHITRKATRLDMYVKTKSK